MKLPDEQLRVLVGCELDNEYLVEASKLGLAEFSRTLVHFGKRAT